ncbi:MAG: ABC transporter permease [Muribaculaceae bacterium]|nr:ABC transporter permease [Muribaculaceae bacterium]
MKQFRSFVHKEFLHILRDGRTLLILLVMPLVLVLIFGYAVSTEVRGTMVAVSDAAHTPESRNIVKAIDANRYFTVDTVMSHCDDPAHLLQGGKVDVVVMITADEDYQILADGSEPNQAQMRAMYLQQIIMSNMAGMQLLAPRVRFLYNPQQLSEYNFVPGIIGMIIILICALITSVSIVREKEMGTMEVLLASPLKPITIILAKLVPYFIVSTVNLVTIILLAHFAMGVPVAGSLVAFAILSVLYIFVSLALGLLISCAVSSQLAAMLLSVLLFVPTVYLSGMIFPIESLPPALQRPTNVVPATWYIDGARRLLIQGVPVQYLVKDFAVLALQAVVLVFVSFKLFKKRL